MLRTVLLRHETTDGGVHYDWLLERQPGEERTTTFRIAFDLSTSNRPQPFHAEQLTDHRRLYLDFEGPIPGGRGLVSRAANGDCEWLDALHDTLRVRVRFRPTGRSSRGGAEWMELLGRPESGELGQPLQFRAGAGARWIFEPA
ncbi:MAG: hypothetical protein JNM07_08875 [Phycisphaerae bacterium]|nr:hypothetical protein [Phycisphaerae bacterium]